jgi:hypothetical protein
MDKENHDVIVSAKDWDNIDPLWYWMYQPLYTKPQQPSTIVRTWVELTDEQFQAIRNSLSRQEGWDGDGWDLALKEAIEAKLKEKNT